MIRSVLDTNALVAGAIAESGTLARLIDAWRAGVFNVIVSVPILQEVERALEKPYFTQRLTLPQRAGFLALLGRQAHVTEQPSAWRESRLIPRTI